MKYTWLIAGGITAAIQSTLVFMFIGNETGPHAYDFQANALLKAVSTLIVAYLVQKIITTSVTKKFANNWIIGGTILLSGVAWYFLTMALIMAYPKDIGSLVDIIMINPLLSISILIMSLIISANTTESRT